MNQDKIKSSDLSFSDELSDSFIASIVHDLKNFMVPIMSRSEMLLLPDLDEKKRREIARELNKNCTVLMDALNNLVTISKARSDLGEFTEKKFNLKFLAVQAIDFLEEPSSQKNITVTCNIPDEQTAYGDYVMIASVICNLLSNAIKFTKDNGHIIMSSELENDGVRFSIKDDGIGIDAKKIDALSKSNRYFSTTGTHGETGSGLGLMLCFSQLRRHNTDLEYINNPDGGATFSFWLPITK